MPLECIVWLPHSYNGKGPAESCIRILEHFAEEGIETTVYLTRQRGPIPDGINVKEAAGPLSGRIPYRYAAKFLLARLERMFARAIDGAAPGTLVYFWPNVPSALVERARARGLTCVREMINSPVGHAKPILDAAYRAEGLEPSHGISDARVATQDAELRLHDRFFASNPEVEKALRKRHIPRERIMPTSFGWRARSYVGDTRMFAPDEKLRFVFVGSLIVRKGVSTLLKAWQDAQIDGELLLAGAPEECLRTMLAEHTERGSVHHLGYVDDVPALYRSCDVFVFPTHEEGGPQVTYEAAGCGLPVITTPMGAARLVEDGVTGLLVPPGDITALAEAMRTLATDPKLRASMSNAARKAATRFDYDVVSRERAALLKAIERTDPSRGQAGE